MNALPSLLSSLFPFHLSHLFPPPGAGSNSYLNVIMLFGNMWVMPLFFFLAGAAANLSISSRTRMDTYFMKRVLR